LQPSWLSYVNKLHRLALADLPQIDFEGRAQAGVGRQDHNQQHGGAGQGQGARVEYGHQPEYRQRGLGRAITLLIFEVLLLKLLTDIISVLGAPICSSRNILSRAA
jgi:hypothetical protein